MASADVASVDLRHPALVGFGAVVAIVVGAVLGGSSFVSNTPGAWFFGTPGAPFGSLVAQGSQPGTLPLFLVFGGLIVLTRAWLDLVRTVRRHPGMPVRRVVLILALWIAPLLVAPPLFSQDVFSYAGQGELVSHSIDPYAYGPGVLGATPFNTLAGPIWSHSPSPYGPTFLSVDGVIDQLAGHAARVDVLLLRLLAVGGIALAIAALPTLARAWGRDPASVVALGAASPLVVTTLVGGAHNDALMLGLLLAGLAVARRFGPLPGIVLCSLAAGVKAPAALGVLFIAWVWDGGPVGVWTRLRRAALASGICVGIIELISLASGVGWGWVGSVLTGDKVTTSIAPVADVGGIVGSLASLLHIPLSMGSARSVVEVVALVAAGVVALRLLLRAPDQGVERNVGLALLAFVLLGPILWSWYVTWGLVTLAAVARGRLRTAVVVLTVVATFVGVIHGVHQIGSFFSIGPAMTVVLAGTLLLTARVPLRRGEDRQRRDPDDSGARERDGEGRGIRRLLPSARQAW